MEALKNTSMMLILAAVFYGAYQMFVSDPSTWNQADEKPNQEQVIHQGQQVTTPPSLEAAHQSQMSSARSTPPSTRPENFGGTVASNTRLGGSSRLQNESPTGLSLPTSPASAGQIPTTQFPPSQNPVSPQGNFQQGNTQNNVALNRPDAFQSPSSSPGQLAPPASNAAQQQNLMFNNQADTRANNGLQQVGFTEAPDEARSNDLEPIQRTPNNQFPNQSSGFAPTNGGGGNVAMSAAPPMANQFTQAKAALAVEMQTASTEIQAGKLGSALHRLSAWYDRPLETADRAKLIGWLDNLAGEVVYSTKHALTQPYQVQAGDTLGSVAARYKVTPNLLANINFYGQDVADNTPLQTGSELKVIPGPFRAVIDMAKKELTVFVGPLYAGRFVFQTGESAPEKSISNTISYVSVSGIPAQDAQQKHAALSPGNPFGRYCLVVGEEVVLHSPGNNSVGSCLQFQETDMQNLQALLTKGCEVQVIR